MSSAPAKTLSVLLVEDSLADGRLLLEALRPAVYAGEILVQTVKRLALALEELQRFDFSCVLLDLGLPDGRGVDAVSALRAVDQRPAIIVLTGLDDEGVAAQALKLGAQDYLLKGQADAEQLLKLIRRAVQRNRQTLQLEAQRDSGFMAATRDANTLLPNLPLLLDRGRMQQAEARALQQPFGLGVLVLDGLDALREQSGAAYAEQCVRDVADALSEALRPADTLARIAPNQLALLPRPWVSADALADTLSRFANVVSHLHEGRTHTLRLHPKTAWVWQPQGSVQTLEQLLAEAVHSASNDALAGDDIEAKPTTVVPYVAAQAGQWQPWLDINSAQCAGALWQGGASHAEPEAACHALASLKAQLQALFGEGALPQSLALSLPLDRPDALGPARQLQAALASHRIEPREVAVTIPLAAMGSAHQAIGALHSAGFELLLEHDGSSEPNLAELAQWPLQGLRLRALYWQRVLNDNLRGPQRRAFEALLGAAQGLGMRVTACDVDEPAARDALHLIGLRWMQGAALMPTQDTAAVASQWLQTQVLPR